MFSRSKYYYIPSSVLPESSLVLSCKKGKFRLYFNRYLIVPVGDNLWMVTNPETEEVANISVVKSSSGSLEVRVNDTPIELLSIEKGKYRPKNESTIWIGTVAIVYAIGYIIGGSALEMLPMIAFYYYPITTVVVACLLLMILGGGKDSEPKE